MGESVESIVYGEEIGGCSLLFPVLVFQHRISRADEALVVGVALENERHEGRGIFVEGPGDAAQEQEAVDGGRRRCRCSGRW